MNISHGPFEGKRPDLKATPLPPAPFGAWRFWARKRVLLGDPGAVLGSLGGLGAVLRGLGTISGRSWAVFKHSLVPSWPLRGFDLGNVAFSLVLQGSGTPRTGDNVELPGFRRRFWSRGGDYRGGMNQLGLAT